MHMRAMETTRCVEAPKILNNSNLASASGGNTTQMSTVNGNSQAATNSSFVGQNGQRLSTVNDKLRPLLEGANNRFN